MAAAADSGVTLAELVASFSLACDLGLGQPMEHVLRSWQIASRLGDLVGLADEERGALYFVATLAWVGCIADTPEVAGVFGDDIAFRSDSYSVDLAGLPMLGFMLRHVGAGSPALRRLRLGANLVVTGGKSVQRALLSHCLTTARMAERLGLGDDVSGPLQQMFTRWDGKGVPANLGGDAIAMPVRLFHLGDAVEVHHRNGGTNAAVEVARARRGTHFDPSVVDVFCESAGEILGSSDVEHDWDALIAQDPALRKKLSNDELDAALVAVADFTDLRSVHRGGHSRAVADLAARAAEETRLPKSDVTLIRRAGLVHDIGLTGVASPILDKPGALTATERERFRMHPYYAERMLSRSQPLARIGAVASLAHERSDGSGFHRGLKAPAIPVAGRLLAAACAFCALTEPRAHRPARTPKQAAEQLRIDAKQAKFDAGAVDAVLAAAGQRRGKRKSGPAGLTPREIEVLVLIARGASTRQVAQRLEITPKTAETHIERIYTKTGASTRSTATLFAMQHGLLDTLEPLDL